jgi:sensor histidine kinase YesM
MIRFLYTKFYYRLAFGMGAGLTGYLLIVLIFSLQYRYYVIPLRPVDFLSFIGIGIIMTEFLVIANRWLERRIPWSRRPFRRAALQALAGLGITILVVVILRLAVVLLFFPGWLVILADEMVIFLVALFLVLAFDLTELGIFLNTNYRNSLAELEKFRKENAEYQFEMLKLQLNPHFLFNSLNTLSSLVYEDAEKASEFIRRLSDVYRYVLDNRSRELVTLRQEMEFVSSYTYLLRIRFQGMVDFVLEMEEKALDLQIAPMTLQLLIENAVKHNVASRQRPLAIRIFTKNDDLWVTNNLQLKETNDNTGVGLKNIRSRYGFLTSREVLITSDDKTFTVKIPLI